MATWDDVRRDALALPETFEEPQHGTPAWKVRTWLATAPRKVVETFLAKRR